MEFAIILFHMEFAIIVAKMEFAIIVVSMEFAIIVAKMEFPTVYLPRLVACTLLQPPRRNAGYVRAVQIVLLFLYLSNG